MANMTFKASLLPNTDLGYSLGSSNKRWKFFGNLEHITLDNTTLNTTAGTFAYSGSGAPFEGCDWVGLQVGDSVEKFQIMCDQGSQGGAGSHLAFRFNDSGGTNGSWGNWQTYVNRAGDTMTGTLAFNKTSDGAIISNRYNGTDYNTIRNHNNGNISLSASGAGLFIGYENTTGVNILGTKSNFSGTTLRVGESSSGSEGQVRAVGGAGLIYLYSQTSTTGNRGLYGANASGTSVSILTVNKDNAVHLNGNAATASKLATARNIAIAGAVTGNANFDGSANITITTSVNHNHDSLYSKAHAASWSFTTTQPLSNYVTFDQSNPTGAPSSGWYNGFISSHNNYLASYIVNEHRTGNWYVGYGQYTNGSAPAPTWYQLLHSGNYSSWTVTKTGGGASGTWGINITGNAANITGVVAIAHGGTGQTTALAGYHALEYRGFISDANNALSRGEYAYANTATNVPVTGRWGAIFNLLSAGTSHNNSDNWIWQICANTSNQDLHIRNKVNAGGWSAWKQIWVQGDAVTGAVWNDYAEFRQADTIESGYVLIEKGDDTLIKSTKRLQDFAGVSSDTWGFAQGETENAKTPIAVAGRVLVYTDKDRKYFKTGDYVCTGKDGKVSKMHWWEKILFPHKVVGIVSSVPDYEEWGGGDRPPVKVDGRVWIKVCQ